MQSFIDFMRDHGFDPEWPLDDSGTIVRFAGPDERSKKSAWYWYVGDAGIVGDWRTGDRFQWFKRKGLKPAGLMAATPSRKERKRERAGTAASTAQRAREIWEHSKVEPHLYLHRKLIQPLGTRVWRDRLLVPVRNPAGDLVNLQFIFPDGSKRFLKGGKMTGHFFTIGEYDPEQRIFITEGFATGATIHLVTGDFVVVAFYADNMYDVATAWRWRKPIIAADNDHATIVKGKPYNAGMIAARQIYEDMGLDVVAPPALPGVTDFNDLYVEHGTNATVRALKQKINRAW